jgi:CubicO group peptidase (beta-lactamase class C family)
MFVLAPVFAASAQLSTAPPESVGMSGPQLERAAQLLQTETAEGRVLAASMLVARDGRVVLHRGFGRIHPTPESSPAKPDTVYLLASISKPISVAGLMLLVERGVVSLADPVSRYLPEFQGGDRAKVRVRDLLAHTSGLPDMLPENTELRRKHAPLSEFVARSMQTPLLYEPGEGFQYQSMGILLASEIAQRMSKTPFREFLKRELFEPLGMKNTALGLGPFKIADTAWCQTGRGGNQDDVRSFGANSPYWRDMGHPWGGVHSTTTDLAILLQTFLNGGAYNGRRVFSPGTVDAMTRDQNRHVGAPWGLGWGLSTSRVWAYFGDLCSPRTFGHSGATGTVAWADPDRKLICIILTTRPSGQDNGRLLRLVSNAVSAAIQ